MTLKKSLSCLVLLGASLVCESDLPVHCMGHEFVGSWLLKVSEPSPEPVYSGDSICGHKRPDDFKTAIMDGDSFDNWAAAKDLKSSLKYFELCIPHMNGTGAEICPLDLSSSTDSFSQLSAGLQPACGSSVCQSITFTMIYDEGFLISSSNVFKKEIDLKMVGLFKYAPKNAQGKTIPDMGELEEYTSFCGETVSGTWTARGDKVKQDDGLFYQGCFVGKKLTQVEPHSSEMRNDGDNVEFDALVAPKAALLETNSESSMASRSKAMQRQRARGQTKIESFLAQRMSVSAKFVQQINQAHLGWQASLDSAADFNQLTFRDALSRLGVTENTHNPSQLLELRSRYMAMMSDEDATFSHANEFGTNEETSTSQQLLKSVTENELLFKVAEDEAEKQLDRDETVCAIKVLGSKFSWLDEADTGCPGVVPEVKNQRSCGSCYAFAAAEAATARLRIAKHPSSKCQPEDSRRDDKILTVDLSPQSILDCSYLNQGCSGGYPMLAGYHAFAEGLYNISCDAYTASAKQCTEKKQCSPYYLDDFVYVGGSYGYGATMHGMMLDLVEYGPLGVAIDASPELQLYDKGVFRPLWESIKNKDTITMQHSYWQKTTHAVLLVGWDTVQVDGKDVPVWIIQNSWGDRWGEKGIFKIPRGVDMIAVETMPVSLRYTNGPATVVGKKKVAEFQTCLNDLKKKN